MILKGGSDIGQLLKMTMLPVQGCKLWPEHKKSVAKDDDDDDDVTCSREWVVPRILLTESFKPFPMLSASSLLNVIRSK